MTNKEIKYLEKKLKYLELTKNLKEVGKAGSYAIAPGIFAGTSLLIMNPFTLDTEEVINHNVKIYNSLNENPVIVSHEFVASALVMSNKIYVYSKWEQKNEEYIRNVYEYDFTTYNVEAYLAAIKENDVSIIEKYFIENSNVKQEIKSEVSIEELNKGNYFEYVIYNAKNNSISKTVETNFENLGDMLFFVTSVVSSFAFFGLYNYNVFIPKINDSIRQTSIEIDEVVRKLSI